MSDFKHKVSDVKEIFSEDLIVGNHDTITLFGIHAQNRLAEYSRKVTTMLLKETENLDYAISETLMEIGIFEKKTNNHPQFVLGRQFYRKEVLKEFTKVLSYIDKMVLYFKLQQAQLIKEIKLLEKLSCKVVTCSEELDECIEIGKKCLLERDKGNTFNNCSITNEELFIEDDMWYKRLEKRIDDLSISHTIAMQSYGQIKVLHDNNLIMLDKIAGAISNTFPVWQNQMAIMLGVELLEKRLELQEKIESSNERYVGRTPFKKKGKSSLILDVYKIQEMNEALTKALIEMAHIEKETNITRKKFVDTHTI